MGNIRKYKVGFSGFMLLDFEYIMGLVYIGNQFVVSPITDFYQIQMIT